MRNLNDIAKKIFKSVEEDLRYRYGIGDEWDSAEQSTIKEIRETNEAKILEILEDLLYEFTL